MTAEAATDHAERRTGVGTSQIVVTDGSMGRDIPQAGSQLPLKT
ncbi:hypothetical protein [Caballeronia fortuita]|nr:hypothetical protein [Caballeronia fortuita]